MGLNLVTGITSFLLSISSERSTLGKFGVSESSPWCCVKISDLSVVLIPSLPSLLILPLLPFFLSVLIYWSVKNVIFTHTHRFPF